MVLYLKLMNTTRKETNVVVEKDLRLEKGFK